MAICGKMVEGGGGVVSFPCTVEPKGHDGPCATPEKPATVRARERWLAEQTVVSTTCMTCNDTGKVPAVPGLPSEGWEPCPICTPPEEYARWKSQGLKRREGDQPVPVISGRRPVQELIIEDWKQRLAVGVARYGTGLQLFNGRNGFRDLYEELIDATNYTRQVIEERQEMLDKISEVLADHKLSASPTIIALLHDLKRWLEA